MLCLLYAMCNSNSNNLLYIAGAQIKIDFSNTYMLINKNTMIHHLTIVCVSVLETRPCPMIRVVGGGGVRYMPHRQQGYIMYIR